MSKHNISYIFGAILFVIFTKVISGKTRLLQRFGGDGAARMRNHNKKLQELFRVISR